MITKQLLSLRLRFKTKVILSAVLPFCAVILFFALRSDPPNEASDTVTGNQDETCVGENAKVKDPIKPLYGTKASIVELTGRAPECSQPAFPIHAVVTPISRVSPATAAKIKASLVLPTGWALLPLTDDLRDKGAFLYAFNPATKARFIISAVRRESIDDMPEYAKANRLSQIDRLSDAHPSEIENLEINKLNGWRFIVRGTGRAAHQDSTYLETIIDAENEVILLNAWAPTAGFSSQEADLEKLAFAMKGLASENNISNPAAFAHQETGHKETTSLFGFSNDSNDDNSDMTAFVPKGGVDLPPGFSKAKLSPQNKADGVFFSAFDKDNDGGVEMSSVARNAVDTVLKYVKTRIDTVVSSLINPQQSDIEELEINGMQAWRFQVRGIDKVSHKDSTYLETVIDSGEKIVVVSTWAPSADFPSRKTELSGVAYSIKGADGVTANSGSRKPNSPDDPPFVSKATMDLPDGWIKATITEAYKLGGVVLYALNQNLDGGIIMSAVSQDTISNMPKYAKLKLDAQARNLTEPHSSEISQLQINGLRAWRFQVQGVGKTSGKDYTYLVTLLESKNEIVLFNVFVATAKFADHKEELGKLASSIRGLEIPNNLPRFDPIAAPPGAAAGAPSPANGTPAASTGASATAPAASHKATTGKKKDSSNN